MVHGRVGTAASEKIYVSGGGIGEHEIWGLGGNDQLFGWTLGDFNLDSLTLTNSDPATNDELYGDRTPQDGDIQYDPITNPPGVPGNDSLYGGAGFDKLYGDEGNDSLVGGIGNDTLDGGAGDDILRGGQAMTSLTPLMVGKATTPCMGGQVMILLLPPEVGICFLERKATTPTSLTLTPCTPSFLVRSSKTQMQA